jgi:hypothetical protein
MKIHELEDALKGGRRIRRVSWPKQMYLFHSDPGSDFGRLVRNVIDDAIEPYSAGMGDLFAYDWEVIPNACDEAYKAWREGSGPECVSLKNTWDAAWGACERSVY